MAGQAPFPCGLNGDVEIAVKCPHLGIGIVGIDDPQVKRWAAPERHRISDAFLEAERIYAVVRDDASRDTRIEAARMIVGEVEFGDWATGAQRIAAEPGLAEQRQARAHLRRSRGWPEKRQESERGKKAERIVPTM